MKILQETGTIPKITESLTKSTMNAKPKTLTNFIGKQSYAQKLDQFMADSNLKFIE